MPELAPPASRYRIHDKKRLERWIQDLVNRLGDGSVNAASEVIGIPQPTLWRLHRLTSPDVRVVSLTRATLSLLEKAALSIQPRGKQLRKELLLCVMTPAAVRLLERGLGAWCRERKERFLNRRGYAWNFKPGEPPIQLPGKAARYRALTTALQRLLDDVEAKHSDIFLDLHTFAMSRGIDSRRVHVSKVRIVEPLAEWRASALFEPRARELTKKQQRSFLRYGLLREKILMDVELSNSQARANLIARGELPPFKQRREDDDS